MEIEYNKDVVTHQVQLMATNESVAKPIVIVSHIVVNIIDGGTQYFAWIDNLAQMPEDAIWVALGDTEKNWIEIHPVEEVDSTTLELSFEVVLDDKYPLPSWVSADTKGCRWFSEKYE